MDNKMNPGHFSFVDYISKQTKPACCSGGKQHEDKYKVNKQAVRNKDIDILL